jgi:hypothetical protein
VLCAVQNETILQQLLTQQNVGCILGNHCEENNVDIYGLLVGMKF